MKNALKLGVLSLAIAATILACDLSKSKSTTGQTTPDSPKVKTDTPAKMGIDTAKKDTTKK